MGFYRNVSPTEISYLATDTKAQTPYVNRFIIEGKGEFLLADWEKAIEIATDNNPGINLQLSGYWGWRKWKESTRKPEIKVITSKWDGLSSEASPLEITQPINPRAESGVRIIFMKNPNDPFNLKILFSVHHSITDGMGTIRWIKDIFRALNNKPCFGAKGKTSDLDIEQNTKHPPTSVLRGNCLPLVEKSLAPEATGHRWIRTRWIGNNQRILARVLSAFNQLARAQHGDGKVMFRIPSDLRSYLDPKQPYTLANCTGALDILVRSFDTPDTIEAAIVEAKKNKQDLSVFIPNFKYACWMPNRMFVPSPKVAVKHHCDGVCSFSALVSHLGKNNYRSYSYEKFKALSFYGVPTPVGEGFYVGIMSDNDGASICIGAPKALVTHERLQAFCSDTIELIARSEESSALSA